MSKWKKTPKAIAKLFTIANNLIVQLNWFVGYKEDMEFVKEHSCTCQFNGESLVLHDNASEELVGKMERGSWDDRTRL